MEVFSRYMAVQYDKEKGFTTWLDSLKKEIANVSSEINTLFDDTISKMSQKQWDEIFEDENGWDNFIAKNQIADENFKEFLSTVEKSKFTLEDYQQWLIQNGKATSTFTSFTQKAGTALKTLGAAMASMAINWAISEIISFAIKSFDNLANSAEHCKERVDSLMDSYKSAMDTANSNAKTVESIADRYEELSKGVNNLGENVSLTTDEGNAIISIFVIKQIVYIINTE